MRPSLWRILVIESCSQQCGLPSWTTANHDDPAVLRSRLGLGRHKSLEEWSFLLQSMGNPHDDHYMDARAQVLKAVETGIMNEQEGGDCD